VDTKLAGYLLLLFGLLLIVIPLYNVYMVFTGHSQSVQLFKQSGISLDLRKFMGPGLSPSLDLVASSSGTQMELLSADSVNRLFNLSFHLVFMGFIVSVGFRIATLGNQLLRPIEVKLNSPQANPS
jgi:hypothetical protein